MNTILFSIIFGSIISGFLLIRAYIYVSEIIRRSINDDPDEDDKTVNAKNT